MEAFKSYPLLKGIPEVSSRNVTGLATGPSPSDVSADTAAVVLGRPHAHPKPAALFTTAPSSSNGETLLNHTSQAADSTAEPQDAFADAERVLYSVRQRFTTSIELSPPPSVHESLGGSVEDVVSPTHSEILMEEEGDTDEVQSDTEVASDVVRSVWTRQVHVGPSVTVGEQRRRTDSVLSEAASNFIAHALHRASLLRRCLATWQAQHERQHQRRQHQQLFAQEYFEHNLRYLLFRAWQWRYAHRRQGREVTRRVEEFRERQLCKQALTTWRLWRQRQQRHRQSVQELQLAGRAAVRSRFFTRWQQWSGRRGQSRALDTRNLRQTRQRFFEQWRTTVMKRSRLRLLAGVVSLHTPASWSITEDVARELRLRCGWIQWLRVTMQRRAARLQHRAACVSLLSAETGQAHLRRRYFLWLRVTFACLQNRQLHRTLQKRFFEGWSCLARLSLQAKRQVTEGQNPRVVRRCLTQWRTRCRTRERQRTLAALATMFTNTVVKTHAARCAFSQWHLRWSVRVRTRRMRRVAEAYARPALLRHLFVRRVTDSVLGTVLDSPGVSESAQDTSRAACSQRRTAEEATRADAVRQETHGIDHKLQCHPTMGWRPPVVSSTTARSSMKPPIPLHPIHQHQQHSLKATAYNAAESREAPSLHPSGPPPSRSTALTAHTPLPVVASAQELNTTTTTPSSCSSSSSPPPPTYEEVMGLPRSAAAAAAAEEAAVVTPHVKETQRTRSDVGVGTENEPCVSEIDTMRGDEGKHQQSRHREWDTATAGGDLVVVQASSPYVPCSAMAPLSAAYAMPPFHAPYPMPYTPHPGWCFPPYHVGLWQQQQQQQPRGPSASTRSTPCAPTQGSVSTPSPADVHGAPSFHAEMQMKGSLPSSPSPRTHDGADTHGDVDSFAGLVHTVTPPPSETATRSRVLNEQADRLTTRKERGRGKDERFSELCLGEATTAATDSPEGVQAFVTPVVSPRKRIPTQGRVPLSLAHLKKAMVSALPPQRTHEPGDEDDRRPSSPETSTSSSSASYHRLQPTTADTPLVDAQSIDSAALRRTARTILEDYRQRTRLHLAEEAELRTLQSQLQLERQLGISSVESEERLMTRQRYLQHRLLAWQQKRAQVAQLSVVLQSHVSGRASAAASQVGGNERTASDPR